MSSNNSVSEEKMLGGEPKALVKAGSDSSEKHAQALQRQLDEALVRVRSAEAKAASLERDLAHAHKRCAELEGEAKMRDAKLKRDFSDAEASSDEESESEEEDEGGEWVTCANCKHKTCVEDLGDVCEFCAEDSDDEFVAQGDEGHFDDKKRKVPESKDEPRGKKARASCDL